MSGIWMLIAAAGGMVLVFGLISVLSNNYSLNGIKSRTVGDGQHGTARWATPKEIQQTYIHVPFRGQDWRQGENLPSQQGLILGSTKRRKQISTYPGRVKGTAQGGFHRDENRQPSYADQAAAVPGVGDHL